jgi:hypothetical protein
MASDILLSYIIAALFRFDSYILVAASCASYALRMAKPNIAALRAPVASRCPCKLFEQYILHEFLPMSGICSYIVYCVM